MPRFSEQVVVPYSAARIFALVADVERYPEFAPAYEAVRVIDRTGERLVVEQVLRLYGIRARFCSIAAFDRPRGIHIWSEEGGPFEQLDIQWSFREVLQGRTSITFAVSIMFRNTVLDRLIQGLGPRFARRTLRAFVARAEALYGP